MISPRHSIWRISTLILLGLALSWLIQVNAEPNKRATVCNDSSELCSRLYSNVTYIGAHNSYANGTLAGASGGVNQEKDVTAQLNNGIRLLQNQGHRSNNNSNSADSGIHLCHSNCAIYDGGSLESYLGKVKKWVDENPNQVITLIFVNSDDLPASQWARAFESTQLASKVYIPPQATISRESWPTLGSLIDSGRTVIVFIDNSADTSTVPYILPQFQNIWETPYDQTSIPFNCSVDRIHTGPGPQVEPQNLMYLTNHYLDTSSTLFGINILTPNTAEIKNTNSLTTVLENANNCASQHNTYPTFILVDFFDQGDGSVLKAAAQMNRVQYTGNVKAGPTANTDSQSGSKGSTSGTTPTYPSTFWVFAVITFLTILLV